MQCADYGVYAAAVKASFPMSVMLGEVWTGIVVEWKLTAVSEYYTLHKQLFTLIDGCIIWLKETIPWGLRV